MGGTDFLKAGDVFAGHYHVEHSLSAGGMGAVYVVTHLPTQRRRALKVMHAMLAKDPKHYERFQREAHVGAQIASDHIVEVFDAGIDSEHGMPWLVMELLEGRDLRNWVEQEGPFSAVELWPIVEQILHGVEAAHAVSVVHRDLKPENIFLARARRANEASTIKILDFGIAKVIGEIRATKNETRAIGTPMWMAPEQTQTGNYIQSGTDIWSLGLLVFYFLTGKSFWLAANQQASNAMTLLREVVYEPIPAASTRAAELGVAARLPRNFDAWFERCLQRDLANRFGSVAELRSSLQRLLLATDETTQERGAAATPNAAFAATEARAPRSMPQPISTAPMNATAPMAPASLPPQRAHTASGALTDRSSMRVPESYNRWRGAAGVLLFLVVTAGVFQWYPQRDGGDSPPRSPAKVQDHPDRSPMDQRGEGAEATTSQAANSKADTSGTKFAEQGQGGEGDEADTVVEDHRAVSAIEVKPAPSKRPRQAPSPRSRKRTKLRRKSTTKPAPSRSCKRPSDCPSGYDCSYGGKCVPL